MTFLKGFLSLLSAILLSSSLSAQGYRIEVEFKGLSNDTIILGEYFTSRMIPKDTSVLDQNGRGVFQGNEAFTGGLYLVYLDPGHYFDLLLGGDQDLFVSADTSDLVKSISFRDSEDNRIFQEYKFFLQGKRAELDILTSRNSSASAPADSSRIAEEQKRINKEMEAYMDQVETDYSSLFVSDFIGATRDPIPPDNMLNGERRHDDSIRFYYYREHYFDRFDPFNVRLLHTPLYEGKIMNYLTRAVPQHPDSLMMAVDFLLNGSKQDDELYRYMLITLFNHFAESKFIGMDGVYFHIAEFYYIPDATWSSPEFIDKLQENLELNKPTLIGQRAPNLILRQIPDEHFGMAAQDTAIKKDPHIGQDFYLHDIDAPFTILYFWETDCGHCQKSTPALHEVYTRLKEKEVEVLSVHVINSIEGKEQWVDFINENHLLGWVNCWSPYSNDFRRLYNLQSYPQLFVLGREKEIVAKRVTPEQAEQIINNLIEIESSNNIDDGVQSN
ncbi:MAG: thioredoxin-like domain-containing protein [Bacteroidota bacterium]|nr:thioredoxin-like domain-containing protein [Bacteroidota bacterium]